MIYALRIASLSALLKFLTWVHNALPERRRVMSKPMLELSLLSGSGIAVLGQLFVCGPVADGNIIDKNGRRELVHLGLAMHSFGWSWLTEDGVRVAVEWNRKDLIARRLQHWVDKLRRS